MVEASMKNIFLDENEKNRTYPLLLIDSVLLKDSVFSKQRFQYDL